MFNLPVLGMNAGVVVAEIMVISFVVTGSAVFCVVEEVFCGVDVDA